MVLVFTMAAAALSGCGKKEAAAIDPKALADKLQSEVGFADDMSTVETQVFYALYNLTEAEAEEAVLIGSTGATAEEIAVIKCAPDQLETVKKAVDDRIAFQRDGFEDYVPEEMKKLSDPVIVEEGDYVILCVSNHNEKARSVIEAYVKGVKAE